MSALFKSLLIRYFVICSQMCPNRCNFKIWRTQQKPYSEKNKVNVFITKKKITRAISYSFLEIR